MKKFMLIVAILAIAILANGCSEEEKLAPAGDAVVPADAAAVETPAEPEAAEEGEQAVADSAVKAACPKDCDKPCCAGKAACDKEATCKKDCSKCPDKETCKKACSKKACPKDCDKPCCAKAKACPKDCDKPCCAKAKTCPKDCDKPCCKKEPQAAACPKDCTKPCCAKADAACPKDCPKDCCVAVVTVNGQKITEKTVSQEVEKRLAVQQKRMPPGSEMPETYHQQIRKRVVDSQVEQALLSQQCEKKNLTISDDEVIAEITKIAGQNGQSLEDVEAEITTQYGMTMEDLKGQIRYQMQVQQLMETENPDGTVTQEDAKKFYDENPQHFVTQEQVKASHILCGKRGITEDQYPAELAKIEAAKARLDAGEAFEDVAKDISTCPSSAKGGDLGFFGKGQMDPAFEKAAFELEPGQTSGIVKSSFGYHLIKVTDKTPGGTRSFEDEEAKITQFLVQQKQREFWPGYQQTMRENAVIEFSEKEQAARDAMEEEAEAQRAARAAQRPTPQPVQPAPAPKPETTEEK